MRKEHPEEPRRYGREPTQGNQERGVKKHKVKDDDSENDSDDDDSEYDDDKSDDDDDQADNVDGDDDDYNQKVHLNVSVGIVTSAKSLKSDDKTARTRVSVDIPTDLPPIDDKFLCFAGSDLILPTTIGDVSQPHIDDNLLLAYVNDVLHVPTPVDSDLLTSPVGTDCLLLLLLTLICGFRPVSENDLAFFSDTQNGWWIGKITKLDKSNNLVRSMDLPAGPIPPLVRDTTMLQW